MIQATMFIYASNLRYAHNLVADLTDEQAAVQPAVGMNHPLWVLGHLACTSNIMAHELDVDEPMPAGWDVLFGPVSKPEPKSSLYPSKTILLNTLVQGHQRVDQAANRWPADQWSRPVRHEFLKTRFSSLGMLIAALVNHEAIHLGQLSAWRRVQGLPSVNLG